MVEPNLLIVSAMGSTSWRSNETLTSGAAHSKVPSALTLVSPRVRMRAKPTSAIFATPSRLSSTAATSI